MGEVIDLPVITSLDLPPERVLAAAQEAELSAVVVLGYDAEGREYFATSVADGGTALWLAERFKLRLLEAGDDSD